MAGTQATLGHVSQARSGQQAAHACSRLMLSALGIPGPGPGTWPQAVAQPCPGVTTMAPWILPAPSPGPGLGTRSFWPSGFHHCVPGRHQPRGGAPTVSLRSTGARPWSQTHSPLPRGRPNLLGGFMAWGHKGLSHCLGHRHPTGTPGKAVPQTFSQQEHHFLISVSWPWESIHRQREAGANLGRSLRKPWLVHSPGWGAQV